MKLIRLLAITTVIALLAGCGGTTVYDSSKTIVYKDNIYNVTDTKKTTTTNRATKSDNSTVNLRDISKKNFENLVEENGGEIYVRMSFWFDGEEMIYRAQNVEKWREYEAMESDFERAKKKVAKLMAEKKTAQLDLK